MEVFSFQKGEKTELKVARFVIFDFHLVSKHIEGWLFLVYNLPRDDYHLFYIFPMDDSHFGYKQKFPQKQSDTELCDGIRLKWTYEPFCDYFVNYSFNFLWVLGV